MKRYFTDPKDLKTHEDDAADARGTHPDISTVKVIDAEGEIKGIAISLDDIGVTDIEPEAIAPLESAVYKSTHGILKSGTERTAAQRSASAKAGAARRKANKEGNS